MGAVFENLTCEELCDLMCGKPEEEEYEMEDIEGVRLEMQGEVKYVGSDN